jgi:hypothetical protein
MNIGRIQLLIIQAKCVSAAKWGRFPTEQDVLYRTVVHNIYSNGLVSCVLPTIPRVSRMFGSTFVVNPPAKENDSTSIRASFEIYRSEVTYLNTHDYKCDEHGDNEILPCFYQYIEDKMMGVLPWQKPNGKYPLCREQEQVCLRFCDCYFFGICEKSTHVILTYF